MGMIEFEHASTRAHYNGSACQAAWPNLVFTCHFTWEAGCAVAFHYLSGRLLGVGRWKVAPLAGKLAHMRVQRANHK